MNKSELFKELFNRYGAVTRARGPFIYTKKGVRVTDLYQEAGRAILGWEGGSAFTLFKNVLTRGQTGSFICEEAPVSRLEKAVSELESDSNLGIVYCHADLFGLETGKWNLPDYDFKYEILDNCIFVSAVFRREDWVRVGGFCEDLHHGMEDYDFWLSILELGRSVLQFEETLFHYRIKDISRTSLFLNDYDKVQQTYLEIFNRHKTLYSANFETYCIELRRNLIVIFA